jgi:hypothetical protein
MHLDSSNHTNVIVRVGESDRFWHAGRVFRRLKIEWE